MICQLFLRLGRSYLHFMAPTHSLKPVPHESITQPHFIPLKRGLLLFYLVLFGLVNGHFPSCLATKTARVSRFCHACNKLRTSCFPPRFGQPNVWTSARIVMLHYACSSSCISVCFDLHVSTDASVPTIRSVFYRG